jgi:outer membrane protein assembly factor BamB
MMESDITMKRTILVACIIAITAGLSLAAKPEVVYFADPDFEQNVRSEFPFIIEPDEPITAEHMLQLYRIHRLSGTDPTGLEYAINLVRCLQRSCSYSDISVFSGMKKLSLVPALTGLLNEDAFKIYLPQMQYNNPDMGLAYDTTQFFDLSIYVIGNGIIEPNVGPYTHERARVVRLVASPNDVNSIIVWRGTDDDSSRARSNSVLMDTDKTVTVQFVDEPAIFVDRPAAGDIWTSGSIHNIEWSGYGVGTVDILYSKNSGGSWHNIATGTKDTGGFPWHLPDIIDSNQCLVKVVPSIPDPCVSCVDSGLFTIKPGSPDPAIDCYWKSLGGDYERSGLSRYIGPEVDMVRWYLRTAGPIYTAPTIGVDERIHIPCEDGILYTIDTNGTELWSFRTDSPPFSDLLGSPSVGPDGTVYIGADNGRFYAIDKAGRLRWTLTTDSFIYSSPAVSTDGKVYACSTDGIVYALGQDGSELWKFETKGFNLLGNSVFGSPAIGKDGSVYVSGLYDPNLYALDANTGTVKWVCNLNIPVDCYLYPPEFAPAECGAKGSWPFASPVVGRDGTIYQSLAYDPNFYAIEPNEGSIIWSVNLSDPAGGWFDDDANVGPRGELIYYDLSDSSFSEPAIGPDGTIYVSFDDPYLRAVEPNGSIKWVKRLGDIGGFTMAVGRDGIIYAAGEDANLYLLNPDGEEITTFSSVGSFVYPVVGPHYTVYVGASDNRLWALTQKACSGQTVAITVTKPSEGAVWAAGSTRTINWDNTCVRTDVDIFYTIDNGENWSVIDTNLINIGSYEWQLPQDIDSNQCMVRVVASEALDFTEYIPSGLFTIHPDTQGETIDADWPALSGDFHHTGLSNNTGPEIGCVEWLFEAGGPVSASATIGAYDYVHIASEDGNLYTIDINDGSTVWIYEINSPILSAPSVGPDGSVYVGAQNGRCYVIDKTGNLRWTHDTTDAIYSSAAVSENGSVYVCSTDGFVYALGPDGSELWKFETAGFGLLGNSIFASPAIGKDGAVYIAGLYDPNFYAFEPNSGSVKWVCNLRIPANCYKAPPLTLPVDPYGCADKGSWLFASPVVGEDGTIYQSLLYDPNLYAIEPNNGSIKWSVNLNDVTSGLFDRWAYSRPRVEFYYQEIGESSWSEPVLGPDGTIYVSFDDPYVRAVEPNGALKWVARPGSVGGYTMAVGANGLIYAAGDEGFVFVLNDEGKELSRFEAEKWLSFPVITPDNTLLVSDSDNCLWAIGGGSCPAGFAGLYRPADIDKNRIVDFIDFATLAEDWLRCTDDHQYAPCSYTGEKMILEVDINRDYFVDLKDIEIIAEQWLRGN